MLRILRTIRTAGSYFLDQQGEPSIISDNNSEFGPVKVKKRGMIRLGGGSRIRIAGERSFVSHRGSMSTRAKTRLGRFLKKCRLESRLSLRDVERLSEQYREKIANSYLSNCERGEMVPSLAKLLVLAGIYGKPVPLFMDHLELDILWEPIPENLDSEELRKAGIDHAQMGNLGRAYAYFERRLWLLETGPAKPSSDRLGELHMDLAIVLKRLGKLQPAREELEKCLRLQALSKKSQARCLDLLAGTEREMGSYLLARLHSAEALRLARELNDLAMIAHTGNTMGNILFDAGEPDGAYGYYETALSTFRELDDPRSFAITASNLGNCLVADRRFDRGIRWIRRALKTVRTLGYKRLVADFLACLARAFYEKGDLKNSEHFAFESISLARKGDYFDILFTSYYYLWKAALKRNLPIEEKRLLKSLRYFRSKIEGTSTEVRAFENDLMKRKGDS